MKRKFRAWLGERLRFLADRIDRENAFSAVAITFKIIKYKGLVVEQTEGVQVHPEPEGVQLWYIASEYDRKKETWE